MRRLVSILFLFAACTLCAQDIRTYNMGRILGSDNVHLSGPSNRLNFNFILPSRVDTQSLQLIFNYQNSTLINEDISNITFWLNDMPVGQGALSKDTPRGSVTVTFPPTLLKVGLNKMAISYVLDNAPQAVAISTKAGTAGADVYWLNIEASTSYLELTYKNKILPASFNSLPQYVFAPNQLPSNIHIVLPSFDNETLKAVFNLAADIAIIYPKTRLNYSVSNTPISGADNFIINYIDGQATISITSLDSGFEDITISVPAPGQIARVAAFLARPQLDYMVTSKAVLTEAAPIGEVDLTRPVLNNTVLSFKQLNFNLQPFVWGGVAQKAVFAIPSDVLLNSMQDIILKFDYNYNAGFAKSSIIKVDINEGAFITALPVASPGGDNQAGYAIKFPSAILNFDKNTIVFTPVFSSINGDSNTSQMIQAQILPTSTMQIPKLDAFAILPNLTAFGADGFPFNSGGPLTLKLLDKNPISLTAALNFYARLNLLAINKISISDIDDTPVLTNKGNILLFGIGGNIPGNIASLIPCLAGASNTKSKTPFNILIAQKFFKTMQPSVYAQQFKTTGHKIDLTENNFVLSMFQNPNTAGATVLFVGAASAQVLEQGSKIIFTDNTRTKLGGASAVFSFDEHGAYKLKWFDEHALYTYGSISYSLLAYALFKGSPWLLTISIFIVIFILAMLGKKIVGEAPED